MANTFLKPSVIANMAVGLLERELVVPRTMWTDAVNPGEFTGALDDTVNLRVPARRTARTRTLRAGTAIVNDTSAEFAVAVKLTTDVYNGAPITDEELTLDIRDFAAQILRPQVRAVAEGVEQAAADSIADATYPAGMQINADATEFVVSGQSDWYEIAVRARKLLNQNNVPFADRTLLIGTGVEEQVLRSDRFARFDSIGSPATETIREATIGRMAGFNVVISNAIDPGEAFAYHKSAFVLATRAPAVPRGATSVEYRGAEAGGAAGFLSGFNVRWLMDYDYTNTTDRSLVNTWIGTAPVLDPDTPSNPASTKSQKRAVKIINGS